jgi:hypothetical protein
MRYSSLPPWHDLLHGDVGLALWWRHDEVLEPAPLLHAVEHGDVGLALWWRHDEVLEPAPLAARFDGCIERCVQLESHVELRCVERREQQHAPLFVVQRRPFGFGGCRGVGGGASVSVCREVLRT